MGSNQPVCIGTAFQAMPSGGFVSLRAMAMSAGTLPIKVDNCALRNNDLS
jgi:hypothetical protein